MSKFKVGDRILYKVDHSISGVITSIVHGFDCAEYFVDFSNEDEPSNELHVYERELVLNKSYYRDKKINDLLDN